MTKSKPINFKAVKNVLNEMPEDKSMLGLALIKELEFMKKTMAKLKSEITKNGVVTQMDQGKYFIDRANPAITQYNAMIKNYNSTIKQVYELIPKELSDNFDDFDNDEL